jgi:integrase
MGHNLKAAKGEISVSNYKSRIRLRWRHNGERYSLNLPFSYVPENMHHAVVKAAEVKLDIMKDCFDPSLEKYKVQPAKPLKQVSKKPIKEEQDASPSILKALVPDFNYWCKAIKSIDVENTAYYLYARKLLVKWADSAFEELPLKLSMEKFIATTYNDRLTCLRNFFIWLVKNGKVKSNPLEDVCRKKKRKKINDKRRPLTENEILAFLQAIKDNTHCPTSSRYKHSHYYPFLYFVFYTGVRNAEAIGLRVKHINLTLNTIEISETFARTKKGSHHAARIRKGTKTENVRYLPLMDNLKWVLISQIENKQPDDFVFTSQTGLSIDDQTLQRRVYKPVMKALGFGNKDLYAARHSYGTRSIEQGISANSTAYAMGHASAETALRNYVDVVRPSTIVPAIRGKHADRDI